MDNIKILNFRGISSLEHEFEKGKPTVLVGRNGSGKTSFIDAFKFGINGEVPSNIVKDGAGEAYVRSMIGGVDIEKSVSSANKKAVIISGRPTTEKSERAIIEEATGVDYKDMKIILSSEIVSALGPDDISSIFTRHDKRKIDRDKVIQILENDESKARKAVSPGEKLPADFLTLLNSFSEDEKIGIDEMNKIVEAAKAYKKEQSAYYKEYSTRSRDFTKIVKPEYTEEDLVKKLEEINGVERNIEMAKKLNLAYRAAQEEQRRKEKEVGELKLQRMLFESAKAPDETEKEALDKGLQAAKAEDVSIKVSVRLFKSQIEMMDKFAGFAKKEGNCPILGKACHDAASLLEEIEKKKTELETAIKDAEKKASENAKKIAEIEAKISRFNKNAESYAKLLDIDAKIKKIEATMKAVPDKEELPLKKSYADEKKKLNDALRSVRSYKETELDFKKAIHFKRNVDMAAYVVEAFQDGGIIKIKFLKEVADVIQDVCNEKAAVFNKDMKVKVAIDNGISIRFSFGGPYLPFKALSGGEKIAATAIMTDVINCYFASSFLIIDEANDMDAQNFANLIRFVTDEETISKYENVIIACVNYDEIEEVISANEKALDVIRF